MWRDGSTASELPGARKNRDRHSDEQRMTTSFPIH